jgi:hypothetical protein
MADRRVASLGAWTAIGIGVGAALGVATDSFALWIAIGVVVGLTIGFATSARRRGDA